MAFSGELKRLLESDEEPLAKRQKLAENVFNSEDLAVLHKEELILKWVCKQLPKHPSLWSTLECCLNSLNFESDVIKLKQSTKQLLTETIIYELTNDSDNNINEKKLICYRLVLTSSAMQQFFKSNMEQFSSLVVSLLNFILSHILKTVNNVFVIDCALDSVQTLIEISKQPLSKNAFMLLFLNDIIFPLCNIISYNYISDTNKLAAETYKCIQHLVFNKANQQQYKECNDNTEPALFTALKNQVDGSSVENTTSVFKLILQAAVSAYKNDTTVIDFIFRKLTACAGKYKLTIANMLFECVNNVTFDFGYKIENTTLTEFIEQFVDEIVLEKKLTSIYYDTLCEIATLNPVIIENKNEAILKRILLEKRSSDADKSSYLKLVNKILEVTVRLRREQKFIIWLLVALKEALKENEKCNITAYEFLPPDFLTKFTASLGNISSIQAINIFRTLIHNFKTDCVNNTNICWSEADVLMIETIVTLMVAYLNGVKIFDHTVSINTQVKFINVMDELKDILSHIMHMVLKMEFNNTISTCLLNMALNWIEINDLILYYSPKADLVKCIFPFSSEEVKQLKKKINSFGDDNCKKAMHKFHLHRLKSSLLNKKSVKLKNFSRNISDCWDILFENHVVLIPFLDNDQILELASFIIADMMVGKSHYQKWIKSFQHEILEQNEIFMVALTCQVFINIKLNIKSCTTKQILDVLNFEKLLDFERKNDNELTNVTNYVEGKFKNSTWTEMEIKDCYKVKQYLKILQHLQIAFFSSDLKKLIFIIIYSICREFNQNRKILNICGSIFSDLFQEHEVTIPEWVEPVILLNKSCEPIMLSKVIELSLRYISCVDNLKHYISTEPYNKEKATVLLKCAEKAASKVSQEQKAIIKKLLKKTASIILDNSKVPITDPDELDALTISLKFAMANRKIKNYLMEITNNTLRHLFTNDFDEEDTNLDNDISNARITKGLYLATLVLRSNVPLHLDTDIPKLVWKAVLKRPEQILIESLLPFVEKSEVLMLQTKMVEAIKSDDSSVLENFVMVWADILKVSIAKKRQLFYLEAIHSMLQIFINSKISHKCWPHIMKLTHCILSATKFHTTAITVDLCILVGANCLRDMQIFACQDVITLCSFLLKYKTDFITDRLASLIVIYGSAVECIIKESRNPKTTIDKQHFCILMLEVEKVATSLIKLKKDVAKLNSYLLADFVEWYAQGVVPSYIKNSLETTIGHIFNTCDQHSIAFLSRCLPSATQEVFKSFHTLYKKFHKFTGKI